MDPEQTDDNQIEGTTTEGNDYEDGSGDDSEFWDYIEKVENEFDNDYSEDDEIDNCLQPRPKDSKSRDANFWFFYNNETRRCELFRYGGEVTGETGGTENKFAFFQECYSQCEHYMVKP